MKKIIFTILVFVSYSLLSQQEFTSFDSLLQYSDKKSLERTSQQIEVEEAKKAKLRSPRTRAVDELLKFRKMKSSPVKKSQSDDSQQIFQVEEGRFLVVI